MTDTVYLSAESDPNIVFDEKTGIRFKFYFWELNPSFITVDVDIPVQGGELRSVARISRVRPIGEKRALVSVNWAAWGNVDAEGTEAYAAALTRTARLARFIGSLGAYVPGAAVADTAKLLIDLPSF